MSCRNGCGLTGRTEMCRPPPDDNPLDQKLAAMAGLACAIVHPVHRLKRARFAVGVTVVTQRAAAMAQGAVAAWILSPGSASGSAPATNDWLMSEGESRPGRETHRRRCSQDRQRAIWSSSAVLIARLVVDSRRASCVDRCNSGSGPIPSPGSRSSPSHQIPPNLRGSLKRRHSCPASFPARATSPLLGVCASRRAVQPARQSVDLSSPDGYKSGTRR